MRFPTTAILLAAAGFLPAQGETKKGTQDPKTTTQKPATQKPAAQKPAGGQVPNPRVLMKTSMGDITLELFANETPETVANFLGLAEGTKEYTKGGKKSKGHFFDGLIFHRVIPDFMAQGGCPDGTGAGSPGYKFADEINAKALGLHKQKAWVKDEKGRKVPAKALLIRTQQQFYAGFMRPIFAKLGIKSQKDLEARKAEVEAELDKLTIFDVYRNMGYKYDDSRPSHRMLRGTIAMANSGPNTNGSQFFINMVDNEYLNGKHTVFGKVVTGMDVVDAMQKVKMKAPSKPEKDIKILSVRRIDAPAKGGGVKAGGAKAGPAKQPKK